MLTLERQLTQSRQWTRQTLFTHFQGIAIQGGYIVVYNYFFPPKKKGEKTKKWGKGWTSPSQRCGITTSLHCFFDHDFFSEWLRGTTPAAAKSTSDPGARFSRLQKIHRCFRSDRTHGIENSSCFPGKCWFFNTLLVYLEPQIGCHTEKNPRRQNRAFSTPSLLQKLQWIQDPRETFINGGKLNYVFGKGWFMFLKGLFPKIYPTILPKIWIAMFKINIKTKQILENPPNSGFLQKQSHLAPPPFYEKSPNCPTFDVTSETTLSLQATVNTHRFVPVSSRGIRPTTCWSFREIPGTPTPQKKVAPQISHTNCHGTNSLKLYRMVNW